ncbi:hypothetical protein [Synechococcus sp. CBW1107]|uniref:hypothetical protein n=1 Tax=Synechococcus sp. CBW1107 TaxID=2789857 RepID=UPI002AD3C064|nr:hypothetical protein [Synechococcus sp. CBW1107]
MPWLQMLLIFSECTRVQYSCNIKGFLSLLSGDQSSVFGDEMVHLPRVDADVLGLDEVAEAHPRDGVALGWSLPAALSL